MKLKSISDQRGEGSMVLVAIVALVAIAVVVFIAIYFMKQTSEEQPEQPGVTIEIPTPMNGSDEPAGEPAAE